MQRAVKEGREGLEVTGGQIRFFTFSTFTEESLTWRHVAFVHDGLAYIYCEMIITREFSEHPSSHGHTKKKEYIFLAMRAQGLLS